MNDEVLKKIDEIINLFENSNELKKMEYLKEKINKNEILLNKINKVKNENIYNDYIKLKKEILNDENFKEYKQLENDLYLLIQEINLKLKTLIKEKK